MGDRAGSSPVTRIESGFLRYCTYLKNPDFLYLTAIWQQRENKYSSLAVTEYYSLCPDSNLTTSIKHFPAPIKFKQTWCTSQLDNNISFIPIRQPNLKGHQFYLPANFASMFLFSFSLTKVTFWYTILQNTAESFFISKTAKWIDPVAFTYHVNLCLTYYTGTQRRQLRLAKSN